MLEKFFHLKENHTDVKTEIMAGITTFMTMAYILAVNPNILSAAGMDSKAVLIATALASFIATALMAVLANYPFALAPGMGLNAYFAYTVVLTMGYSWQLALMAVFVEGVIFIALSLTNVREGIFNAIPMTLKSAVSVGIGLFVAFVGLQNAKLIVNSDSTLVTYQHFKGATFHSVGVGAILALLGVVVAPITSGDSAFRSARLIAADFLHLEQRAIRRRLYISIPLFVVGFAITLMNFGVIWQYFAWVNQTLAAVTLWTITVYLAVRHKNFWIALLPSIFMTQVVTLYILIAPEGLLLPYWTGFGIASAINAFITILFFRYRIRRCNDIFPENEGDEEDKEHEDSPVDNRNGSELPIR